MTDRTLVAQQEDITQSMDFTQLKLGVDSPYCPQCGNELRLNARTRTWECTDEHHESILATHWNTVLLHAAVAEKLLEMEGIEMIIYGGVAIDSGDAVSPSHLLPMIVQAALERVEAVGMPRSFMLNCIEIDETQTPGSLTDLMVRVAYVDALPAESINILTSVVLNAIASCRSVEPSATIMDAHYLLNPGQALSAPAADPGEAVKHLT